MRLYCPAFLVHLLWRSRSVLVLRRCLVGRLIQLCSRAFFPIDSFSLRAVISLRMKILTRNFRVIKYLRSSNFVLISTREFFQIFILKVKNRGCEFLLGCPVCYIVDESQNPLDLKDTLFTSIFRITVRQQFYLSDYHINNFIKIFSHRGSSTLTTN